MVSITIISFKYANHTWAKPESGPAYMNSSALTGNFPNPFNANRRPRNRCLDPPTRTPSSNKTYSLRDCKLKNVRTYKYLLNNK